MNSAQIRPIYGVLRPQTHDVCQHRDRLLSKSEALERASTAVEGSRPFLELPPPEGRMTPGRKARIVDALKAGVVTFDQIEARYGVTAEELALWSTRLQNHGVKGLQVTRTQKFMGGFYASR